MPSVSDNRTLTIYGLNFKGYRMPNIYYVSGTFRELSRQIERQRKIRRLKIAAAVALMALLLAAYGNWTNKLTEDCETRGHSHAHCVKVID